MRSRGREIVSKESKIRGGLHLTMDGDRDRDTDWDIGLDFLGADGKRLEGESGQGRQDRRESSSDDGWR